MDVSEESSDKQRESVDLGWGVLMYLAKVKSEYDTITWQSLGHQASESRQHYPCITKGSMDGSTEWVTTLKTMSPSDLVMVAPLLIPCLLVACLPVFRQRQPVPSGLPPQRATQEHDNMFFLASELRS